MKRRPDTSRGAEVYTACTAAGYGRLVDDELVQKSQAIFQVERVSRVDEQCRFREVLAVSCQSVTKGLNRDLRTCMYFVDNLVR